MRKPFTYCVTHIPTNKRYYGCRYSKDCNPNDLGKTYFTSSKHVKQLIKEQGIQNFSFEVRKVFDSIDKCRKWEHKVLTRLNASKSDKWLNKHNGGQKFYCTEHSLETRRKLSKALKGKNKNPKPDHVKLAVSRANSKRVFSEKQKRAISERVSGDKNPMYGRKRTDTIEFLAAARDKMIIANRCPVVCDGVKYSSVGEAQIAYPGINIRKRLDNPKYPNFFRLRERTRRK